MNLRPYQLDQVRLIRESFARKHKRVILCSPTGSGKSVVMAEMIRAAYEKGSRVMALTHRIELFTSTLKHIGKTGIPCVELNASTKLPTGDWRVMVGMVNTVHNRIKKHAENFLPPQVIIVDEGHLKYFEKVIAAFPEAWVIMFSATPTGSHIHKIYTDIIQNIDIPDLIKQGYLVPCKAYQMQAIDEIEKVKIKGDDFDQQELFEKFDKTVIYKGLEEEYRRYAFGQKGIVFTTNVIEHTVKTYESLKAAGLNAFMVHSGNKQFPFTEAERTASIQEFEASTDGIMVNPGILTTGYDHAPIRWIGVYRAMASLPLWLQINGRGSRPILGADGRADLSAKSHFTILDFGSNHTRLGLWNQPRVWKIQDPKKAKKQKAAPVKTCDCGAMLFASVRVCEFCGKEFPKPTHDMIEGVMVAVDSDLPLGLNGKRLSELSIDELICCQKTGRLKASYVWRILRTKEKEAMGDQRFLSPYAEKMKYSFSWVSVHLHKIDDETQVGYKDYTLLP